MHSAQAWLRYSLPFLPGLPPIGSVWDADCAIILAYGRNRLADNQLHYVRSVREQHPDDQSAIDYFRAIEFDAGRSNRGLARATELVCWHLGCGLMAQWEVPISFGRTHRLWGDRLRVLWPPYNGPYDTNLVLREALAVMEREGWKSPILIAQDYHLARAFLQLKKLHGRSPIVMPVTDADGTKITRQFDRNSVQWQTKHLAPWLIRETPGRAVLLAKRQV